MPDIIVPSPEKPVILPERTPELPEQKKESRLGEQTREVLPKPAALPAVADHVPTVLTGPVELQQKVESILAEGLEQLYQELNVADKAKFKALGESTASKIAELLRQVKVKISQILQLIRQWLLALPKVDRYFAEQEAKIKAAKLLRLRGEK